MDGSLWKMKFNAFIPMRAQDSSSQSSHRQAMERTQRVSRLSLRMLAQMKWAAPSSVRREHFYVVDVSGDSLFRIVLTVN